MNSERTVDTINVDCECEQGQLNIIRVTDGGPSKPSQEEAFHLECFACGLKSGEYPNMDEAVEYGLEEMGV